MTQYYSINSNLPKPIFMKKQQRDNMSSQSNTATNPSPFQSNYDSRRDANRTAADNNKDKHKVYDCASKTLLVGPSIINASPPKNNISLPSLNHFIHNPKDNRNRQRDHPSNHNQWFNVPPPPIHHSMSFSSSTPVTQHRYMMSNSPQQQQQQFTSSDPFVEHDSGTTPTETKRRPLKRQRAITPPIAYILPKKKGDKEKQQCHSCQSTETPEWRKGPLGPRTLCNACGLIWTKLCKQQEEGDKSRRKFKNNHSASPSTSITTMTSPVTMEDCNTSGYCSSSCSSSGDRSPSPLIKKNSNDSKKKLTLSYLLS